jgi:hypothetical protein
VADLPGLGDDCLSPLLTASSMRWRVGTDPAFPPGNGHGRLQHHEYRSLKIMNLQANRSSSPVSVPTTAQTGVSGGADKVLASAREHIDASASGSASLKSVLKAFEARRNYPRVSMRMPIRIGLPGGTVVVAETYNMTPEGLQIRCDRKAACAINPTGHSVPRGNDNHLMVMMRLESPEEIHSCVLRCKWSYMSMADDGEAAFGLEFSERSPEQTRALDTVFSHALRPA